VDDSHRLTAKTGGYRLTHSKGKSCRNRGVRRIPPVAKNLNRSFGGAIVRRRHHAVPGSGESLRVDFRSDDVV
jgi:hypothetical protein